MRKLFNLFKWFIINLLMRLKYHRRVVFHGENKLTLDSLISCKKLVLGYCSRINGYCKLRGTGEVEILQYTAIGCNLTILTSNHVIDKLNMNVYAQNKISNASVHGEGVKVSIGPACWVGDNVTIIKSNIGVGAVIGACTVVTKDVPPFAIVVGNPGKIIGYRFDEKIREKILMSNWWERSLKELAQNEGLFSVSFKEENAHELSI